MEILYYWIDNYRNIIDKQGYNFGGQLLFDFNYEQNELTIRENKLYVKNFFNIKNESKISNLTAVVGKNGVGKSTFLDAVKGLLIDGGILAIKNNNKVDYFKRILVVKTDNLYKVFFHKDLILSTGVSLKIKYENSQVNEKHNLEFISYGNGENVHNFKNKFLRVTGTEVLENTSSIFFSQAFDSNFYYESTMKDRKYYDISTKGLLAEIEKDYDSSNTFSTSKPNHLHLKDSRFNIGLLKEFYINENKKKLKMLGDETSRKLIEKHSFFPERIYLNLDYIIVRQGNFNLIDINESQLLRIEKNSPELNKVEKFIYSYIEDIPFSYDKDYPKTNILALQTYLRRIIDSYFDDVDRFLFFKERKNYLKEFLQKTGDNELKNKTLTQLLDFFLNSTIKILRSSPKNAKFDKGFNEKQFMRLTESYLKFIKYITDIILNPASPLTFLKGEITFTKTDKNVQSVSIIETCVIAISLNTRGIRFLEKLMTHYEAIDTTTNFIKFQWEGLSTGEDALLSIYSRFYEKKDLDLAENIIIFLDEIEHSLHPEWQRRILYNLLEFLPYVFSKSSSIQIILASNVPFLIAEIPTQNIVYLEKSVEKIDGSLQGKIRISNKPGLISQTFAANIHNLLINNFFMESTMGEFSAKKIEEIIKIFKDNEQGIYRYSPNEIWNIIQNIGEPIIRNKLNSMYLNKFVNPIREDEEITNVINDFLKLQDYSAEQVNSLLNTILSKSNKESKYD